MSEESRKIGGESAKLNRMIDTVVGEAYRILAATKANAWGTDPTSLVRKSLSFRANDLMAYADGKPLHTGRGMMKWQATAEQVAIDAVLGMLNRGELVIEKRAPKPEQAPASDDVARYREWVRQGHRDGIISASRAAELSGLDIREFLSRQGAWEMNQNPPTKHPTPEDFFDAPTIAIVDDLTQWKNGVEIGRRQLDAANRAIKLLRMCAAPHDGIGFPTRTLESAVIAEGCCQDCDAQLFLRALDGGADFPEAPK